MVFFNSLALAMLTVFILSWLAQAAAGLAAYNTDRPTDYRDPVSWTAYVASGDFWNRSLQNWQSEFLAVASMAAFSIFGVSGARQSRNRSANQTRRPAPMSEPSYPRVRNALAKSGQEKLISGMAEGAQGTSDDTGIFVADTTNNTASVGVGHAYRAAR